MSGQALAERPCPRCGYHEANNDPVPPAVPYRPWHIRGRAGVQAYVGSLSEELHEWLLALFVDKELNLLAVDTIAQGDISSCPVNVGRIICHGHRLNAAGFILVHNHPSGVVEPSLDDIRATRRIADIARDLELPLLDHLIVAGEQLRSIGMS